MEFDLVSPLTEEEFLAADEVFAEEARELSPDEIVSEFSYAMLDGCKSVMIDGFFEGKVWVIDGCNECFPVDHKRLYELRR